jgi:hypothetical protein
MTSARGGKVEPIDDSPGGARTAVDLSTFDPFVEALGDPRARPDPGWISLLADVPRPEADRVLSELLAFVSLEVELRQRLRGGGRTFYAQLSAPFDVYALTRLLRPRHVVELGVSSGVSSTHFLLGLRQNHGEGLLHSIDLPTFQWEWVRRRDESEVAIPPGRTSGWAVPEHVRSGWDLRIGPTETLLPRLVRELAEIDLFLHDDLHTPAHLAFELRTILPRLRPGSVVLADNTNWTGHSFEEFAEELGTRVYTKRGSHLKGLRVPATAA